ncbi:tRNA (adenosine(37)-N6)-threonylcarbamoyltransferase complex dimerization subunit type 1 TsaB [Tomitella biformata]|uniref:tRNA (adenosine(37)-N6)-threonylcarbamoyltransferase complex dimerization subunit type 1 TsaB n=1 Tax=Tomitella biformata TaxID=630403 RepID=UPI000463D8BE|nr:tRNA (adenosine(37)-N6)-threonylcarbamoyltransferase complex dimerization subunit type 1 TsaB [Tomitella biformata]
MLVLAVDTSTPAVTAGLVRLGADGAAHTLAVRRTVDSRAHAEVLTPQIMACLAEAGAVAADLAAVVVGAGPGPFTGLRVGMVTAASFGDALGIPVHGICSLDAIAQQVFAQEGVEPGELLVVTDARRREIYWARYRAGVRVDGPAVIAPAELDPASADTVAGSPEHAALFALPVHDAPSPEPAAMVAVAAAALLSGSDPEPLIPLYLRRPDATEPQPRKPKAEAKPAAQAAG